MEDLGGEDDHHTLPEHEDDYSHSHLLFRDHDVLTLFHAEFTGSDPVHPVNRSAGVGNLGQAAWFAPLDDRSAGAAPTPRLRRPRRPGPRAGTGEAHRAVVGRLVPAGSGLGQAPPVRGGGDRPAPW
ncbi:hypothetical protein [Streptomyces sp. NPDC007369]|uniref:hypothetical protein n=1 Tax=Streptomyces sp. NPDC007369 TaxID=3154589 RepID=UPI00340948A8